MRTHHPFEQRRILQLKQPAAGSVSRMSAERTSGGGRKAPGGIASSRVTSARHCVSTLSTPYSGVPGLATMRSATSRWSISVASVTGRRDCEARARETESAKRCCREDCLRRGSDRRIRRQRCATHVDLEHVAADDRGVGGKFGCERRRRDRDRSQWRSVATPSAPAAASGPPARTDFEKHVIGERARSRPPPCRPIRARGSAGRSVSLVRMRWIR